MDLHRRPGAGRQLFRPVFHRSCRTRQTHGHKSQRCERENRRNTAPWWKPRMETAEPAWQPPSMRERLAKQPPTRFRPIHPPLRTGIRRAGIRFICLHCHLLRRGALDSENRRRSPERRSPAQIADRNFPIRYCQRFVLGICVLATSVGFRNRRRLYGRREWRSQTDQSGLPVALPIPVRRGRPIGLTRWRLLHQPLPHRRRLPSRFGGLHPRLPPRGCITSIFALAPLRLMVMRLSGSAGPVKNRSRLPACTRPAMKVHTCWAI